MFSGSVPSAISSTDMDQMQRKKSRKFSMDRAISVTSFQRRREECERKARRGEMDPRLEFAFQLLMDGTGLPRARIMDHVFEGNMLDDINQLFVPHARNKLLWFYQEVEEIEQALSVEQPRASTSRAIVQPPKLASVTMAVRRKKLFLTDGWDVPLTGVCIYMFRLNTAKQVAEEGFHKDLYCGILDAASVGLVTAVERIVEHIFMEALARPTPDSEDESLNCPMIKNQLLPGLRSFCSALKG